MPSTEVIFYQEEDAEVPVLDWLLALRKRDIRAFQKCFGLIRLLQQLGHELRRPHADLLRDGVYELRAKVGRVNYRILDGFVGKDVALLAAGFTTEKKVPDKEIERAIARIKRYVASPDTHGFVYNEENHDGENH